MKVHVLKVWPEFYWPLVKGQKTAEFRKDDRDFAEGDLLMLQPWSPKVFSPESGPQGHLNWPAVRAVVSHISRGAGIPQGYALLSLKEVREATIEEDNAAMREPGSYGIKEVPK